MGFWNKKIINFEDRYFGLDLSDFSVKVFQLEKNGRLDSIRSVNSLEIPSGIITNGNILNKEKASQLIKEAVATAGPNKINTKKVICSLPESKVFLRIINIPKVDVDEAKEAIKWEIEASIPLAVDQVYYDWQFLGEEQGKQNVLTVAVAKETVDNLVETLEMSGLLVYGMEMEAISTVRSLIPYGLDEEEVFLIVDIGGEKTSFIITRSNIPYFTSSIPFSASEIVDIISTSLNISKEEAESIKESHGIEHSLESTPIFNAMRPFLENLSVEIEKTIDFYRNMSDAHFEIKKLIVSGGGANLKGLVPYFATRLSREVVYGVPWVNLNFGKNLPIISRNESVHFATAVGLAMYGRKVS